MKTFHIQVMDISRRNKFFNVFIVIALPLFIILWIHLKEPLFHFGKTIDTVIFYSIIIVPHLIFGFKLREVYANEDVSIWNGEIQTKLLGPIKFSDIEKAKTPKNSFWNKDVITVKLQNGKQISFAQSKYDFKLTGNRKRKNIFEDFVEEFETSVEEHGLS